MNHSLQTDRLGFVELAKLAMQMVNKPMTASDLWQFVLQNDLHHQLKTFDVQTQSFKGKTPEVTFSARICTSGDIFEAVPNTKAIHLKK